MEKRITSRKQLIGKVVSTKNHKTIIVSVDIYLKDRLYTKRYLSTRRFSVHDEQEKANLGDVVQISETRPFSKTKHFRLNKIIKSREAGN